MVIFMVRMSIHSLKRESPRHSSGAFYCQAHSTRQMLRIQTKTHRDSWYLLQAGRDKHYPINIINMKDILYIEDI